MPHCPPEHQLERYLAGADDEDDRSTLDSHVSACPHCRAWLVEAQADDALLGGVRAALADPARPQPATHGPHSSSADVHDIWADGVLGHELRRESALGADFAAQTRCDIAAPDRGPLPAHIAGYRILGVLGEGGMGVVYAAEQQNPRRAVALKVIRGSQRLDPQRLRLFRREAEALARLRHAGIAAIHEAGCTDDGQHFFVMELVRGLALDAFARRANLPLRAKLELFLRVCDAIGYAHQRGVIHRDLKPSNILVDDEGTEARTHGGTKEDASAGSPLRASVPACLRAAPKVLDFGLARITDADLAAATVLTEVGKIQGTLAYMSPEQARGHADEIDVRSDVYSLGVILYELLTGERPYSVSRTQLPDAVRVICETHPRRPSTIVRALRGDLETIILKSLEKSPERRYSGVAALRDDLQRYLNNQPILARPPSAGYQLRKLIARHRLAAALAAALLVTVCGFAVWATMQYQHAERLRVAAEQGEARAAAKATTAEEIQRFLQGILVSVDPDEARGRDTEILQELLGNAAARVENELADQPEVAAAIRITIGNTYANLGDLERAEPQLRAAAALREKLFGPDSLPVAEVLVDLGRLLRLRSQHKEGESLLRRALAIRRQLRGEDHIDVAEALNNLGTLLTSDDRTADAIPLFEQAIAIHTRVRGTEDVELATAMSNLGLCYFRLVRLDDAETQLRAALDIRRRVRPEGDAITAVTLANLSTLLVHFKQDRDAAIDVQREVCEIRRRLLPADHPDLVDALRNLAASLNAIDRELEAVPVYYEAVDRQRALLKRLKASSDDGLVADALAELVMLEYELGRTLVTLAFHEEAEPHLRFAAEHRDGVISAHRPACANLAFAHGLCLTRLGLFAEAEPPLLEAHAWHSAHQTANTGDTQRTAAALVDLYDSWGRIADAEPYRTIAAGSIR